jgi:transglutaminase-like putative cysteine protease
MLLLAGVMLSLNGLGSGPTSSKPQAKTNSIDRQFRFWYQVKVNEIPSGSKLIRIWLPIPPSNIYQTASQLEVITPIAYRVYQEKEYFNNILRLEADGELPDSLVVSVSFNLRRNSYSAWGESGARGAFDTEETLRRYLSPDRLIPISGRIKEEAEKVVTKEMSDLEKAKAIYDYVSGNLTYDKSGAGWGRGDALYACNALQGNCTDFHSLLIGMARAVGIPARFVMGFPLPPDEIQGEVSGYHCWAEFYVKGIGWIPVDASEASKFPELQEFYFGNLDPHRVEFSIGRDIRLDPALEPLNFFIYPVVMIYDAPFAHVQTQFHFSGN